MSSNEINETLTNVSKTFLEEKWNGFVDKTSDDPFIMWIFGMNGAMFVIYWSIGMIYMVFDTYNFAFLKKYKTQPGKNEPVDWIKLRKVIKRVIYNQTVVALLYTTFMYPILVWRGGPLMTIREIPTFSRLAIDFIGCMFFREISFYYSHRLLHHRRFYEKHHKRHHEYTAPVAVTAQYADAMEHCWSNLMPVLLGPAVMGAHYFTTFVWLSHVILRTLSDHSGYYFPWYYNPTRHDYHHESFTKHYGVEFFGFMDWIHGTGGEKKMKMK
ncbi:fatty acid hydroxylase domain-containing protein 2-like [Culicoides brevitarsis]|uniref:fatty acid hydroxylase domain-containing protein 2-like n=1 Tax=Culicoides brevitarsis TaxID=469753 RepID=UPI00307CB4EB